MMCVDRHRRSLFTSAVRVATNTPALVWNTSAGMGFITLCPWLTFADVVEASPCATHCSSLGRANLEWRAA